MEKQTKKHYPLENKHSTIGNICCQGCYRMGLEQGKALALADVMKIIDDYFLEQRRLGKGLGVVWEELKATLNKTAQEIK